MEPASSVARWSTEWERWGMVRRPIPLLLFCVAAGCTSAAGGDAPAAVALLGGTSMSDTPWPSDVFLKNGRLVVGEIPIEGDAAHLPKLTDAPADLDGPPTYTSGFFPTKQEGLEHG